VRVTATDGTSQVPGCCSRDKLMRNANQTGIVVKWRSF